MSPASGAIQHVSDTARWVALYRAMESERPDALFHDPYARILAGERAEHILASLPKARTWAWPMVVRTAVMDEMIRQAVERDGVDTVLNLAAGLDARPYRLALPPELRWIEVDFPDVIAYKQEQMAGAKPVCTLEQVGLDLTEIPRRQGLFAGIGSASKQVLVVSEGLLIYLSREQVGALAQDLAAPPTFRRWLIDLAGPRILKMMEKTWGRAVAAGNAPFQFAPAEGTRFFDDHGWTEAEFRSMWEEANRLHRAEVPFAWLWRLLGRVSSAKRREETRRMSGMVLLRRHPA
ncbi:MAG TPA: class I SAM-dependent methyltransferase [Gemmatimonadales bacterium]|nr:class I SAM-dependent methyltransferase [Gemmatimonadales bacterium]